MKITLNPRINLTVWFWTIIIYVFAFERTLTTLNNGISYLDELLAIVTMIWLVFSVITSKNAMTQGEWIILLAWVLVILVGIIGNLRSSLFNNKFYIIVDIISMVKVWLAYYTIILTSKKYTFYDKLIINMAKVARVITVIMFICMIISQFTDIGMSALARYGIKSFKFVFNVPGNFSKFFYFIIPLLTADLYYKRSAYKIVMIIMSCIVWFSTLRSRAFAFVAIYLLVILYFFVISTQTKKMKMRYIVVIVAVAVIICWNQLTFYFTTDNQARHELLKYGIVTMEDYFPIGAGFGTYGSDVASTNYASLYIKYGFREIYGMNRSGDGYLNDNYWPMVLGQFGFIGTLIVGAVVILFIKIVIQEMNRNRYFYMASLSALGFLLLSSVASKSYAEFSSICVFMLLGVLVKRERVYKKDVSEEQIESHGKV